MSNLKEGQKNLQKEDLLQAVIVVDDFGRIFSDFTEEGSGALLPVANYPVIDYTLECLGRCGFQETILFCTSHAAAIKDHLKKSPWSQAFSPMKVIVLVSENCQSLGDALRDVDHKAVIKGDFVLLSAFTITNLNLIDLLKHHRQIFSKDKGAVMTMILQDIGSRNPRMDDSTYVINAISKRLLMHVKSSPRLGKFEIPLDHLVDNVNLNIYSNLMDTGVAICSPLVPLLFSDNFDFQSKEDFIRGLLLNEEILNSRIYCHQVEGGYGATIEDWQTYQRVTLDCIHRWTFPLVPDQAWCNCEPFAYLRNCVYKQPGVQLNNNAKLEMDVVVGELTQIGQKTRVLRSVIGRNCVIGQNVVIEDSFIFNNAVIEDNCTVKLCVIGEKSRVREKCELLNCLLKRKAVVERGSRLEGEERGGECEDGESRVRECRGFVDPEGRWEEEEEEEREEDDIGEGGYEEGEWGEGSVEAEDIDLFYSEVVDSLQRGFEERLSCENLILEINSSRYAYNVSLSDVTVLTLKGVLLLSSRVNATTRELLSYFLPLLKNYVKTPESQMDCLDLVEEICDRLGNDVAKSLHFLYDSDILSEENILKWHEELEDDSIVAIKVAPLIKWLKEAAEESSSEEESE